MSQQTPRQFVVAEGTAEQVAVAANDSPSETLETPPAQEDLLTAALRAVEEARSGSQAASPQSVLVNAILW